MRGLVVAALLACHEPPRPIAIPKPAAAIDDRLDARLDRLAVTDADFYRPVLYSWTTPDQIAALRAGGELLVSTALAGGFISPYLRALGRVSTANRPGRALAKLLLDEPQLARRRYAWPAPMATVLGLGARGYGHALIRIELAPSAWIGRFDPEARDPFRFVDARGTAIAEADVLAHPERIGAIFHVRTEPGISVRFREYVVCNPAMVAAWSVATPVIRGEIDDELAIAHALETRAWSRDELAAPAWRAWSGEPASSTLARWHAVLAFDTKRYRPGASAIADALAAYDPAGAPLAWP